MHSLLKRQLKRHFGDLFEIPPQWRGFIDRVNDAYHEFDSDRRMLEHSLDLSSQELLDANSEMRAVFAAIPDLVFRLDQQGEILDIKAGAADDLMIRREHLIGKRMQDMPIPEVARQFSEAIGQVVAGNFAVTLEYSAALRGQESHYEARLAPLPERQIAVIIRNVTERKQSLRLLGSAVEQSAEAIVIVDARPQEPGGRYQFVNPAFTRMTGYTAAEAIGQTPQLLRGPKSDRAGWRRMREALGRGESYTGETIAYRKDGTEFQMERRVVPIRNSSGTITHFLAIQHDITERKRTEMALRESEEHFRFLNDLAEATRTLADPAQIMAVTARMLGRQLRASRCAYADVENDGEQFTIQHDYTDGCASTVGQYRLSLFGARAVAGLQGGETLIIGDVDAELLPEEGGDMFNAIGIKAIITCPLIKEGGLRAMMAVHQTTPRAWTPGEISLVQEVVERCWATIERGTAGEKLSESKRFAESIAENSTSQIYLIDLETGRNTYSNRNFAERLGYSPEQIREMGETPLQRLIHPEDLGRVLRHFGQFAEVRDNRVVDLEYRMKHADGDWRWIWARDTVFDRRPDGSVRQVMGTAQDITGRKRADAELQAAHKELVEASRQAGMAEIATNVLHNVGNILNSVNVSASLVSSTLHASRARGLAQAMELMGEHSQDLGTFLTSDPKGKLLPAYLQRVTQALAQEQKRMIEELAHLTQSIDHIKDVVATQQSYASRANLVEPLQICDLAEDALRINGGALARHRVTVVKEFAQVPMVRLDRARVLQILVNLISNASNAMENVKAESHQITLTVDPVDGSTLRVSVKDQGEGIPAQNLTRIFAHGFTTRKAGHGFGLHSCALAAQQMGGTLTAHSEGPGRGATFTLQLPVTEEKAEA